MRQPSLPIGFVGIYVEAQHKPSVATLFRLHGGRQSGFGYFYELEDIKVLTFFYDQTNRFEGEKLSLSQHSTERGEEKLKLMIASLPNSRAIKY
jgi:hypothetical protein